MPAIVYLFAGTKNLCPGTRMARSYTRTNHRLVRGRHPQEVAMQATCHQPKAGQDRHHRGCKGLITQSGNPLPAKGWTELTQPQQHTQGPLLHVAPLPKIKKPHDLHRAAFIFANRDYPCGVCCVSICTNGSFSTYTSCWRSRRRRDACLSVGVAVNCAMVLSLIGSVSI